MKYLIDLLMVLLSRGKMQKYLVKSVDGKYTIEADTWSVVDEGLKFYIWDKLPRLGDGIEDKTEYQRWIVAWFTTWDYWMLDNNTL